MQSHLNGVEDILDRSVDRILAWSSEDKSVSGIDNNVIQSEGVVLVSKQVIHDETLPVSIDSQRQLFQDTLDECSKGKRVCPCLITSDSSSSLLIAGYCHLQSPIDVMTIVPPLPDPSTERTLSHLLIGMLELDSGLIYINPIIPTDVCNAKWVVHRPVLEFLVQIPKSEGFLIGSSRQSLLSIDSNDILSL